MGRILAIDYGRKRVGLAVTDEQQLIASPLETVRTADIMEWLKTYLSTHPVECIVVGEPKQMDNTPSGSALFIEPFVRGLRKEFPSVKVERMDERFTSRIASRTLASSGLKKKDRQKKELVDVISATIILQGFLENRGWRMEDRKD
ncbi:MAG TPA: Holliday junction resolvase RuvX [Bacteroidales bacterium]|nr:Holliday junction resolvase RuvX [Bacteroidales bacterium]